MLRRQRFEISGAQAIELRSGATHYAAILLRVHTHGHILTGVGESAPYGRDTRDDIWQLLDYALDHLVDLTVPNRRSAAGGSLRDLINGLYDYLLRSSANHSMNAIHNVLATVEMGLLGITTRVTKLSLRELFDSKSRPAMSASLNVSITDSLPTRLRHEIGRTSSEHFIRVSDLNNYDDAMSVVSLIERTIRDSRPLWLNFTNSLDTPSAHKLLRSLADSIDAAAISSHVIIENPLRSADLTDVGELQALADELIRRRDGGTGLIIADCHATTLDDVQRRASSGLGLIVLDPHKIGGVIQLREISARLTAQFPNTKICLTSQSALSTATNQMIRTAADGTDGSDYYYPPQGESFAAQHATPWDHSTAASGDEHVESFATIAHRIRRSNKRPRHTLQERTVEQPSANSFDVRPLAGVTKVPSHLIERASLAYGLDTIRHSASIFIAQHRELEGPIAFRVSMSSGTSVAATAVVTNKELTRQALLDAGVPVPMGKTFQAGQIGEALKFQRSLPGNAVVKPVTGHKGIGVATDLQSADELESAISALSTTAYADDEFLVESYTTGNDYRFLVVGDEVVSVIYRRPAAVVGDAKSTVLDLVIEKNMTKLQNPHMRYRLIQLDNDASYWLNRQGLTLEDIPELGQEVRLSSTANGSRGADTFEVLDETHPSLLEMAVEATHAIPGLDEAGIDVIGQHERALAEQDAAVIEVNNLPGILLHHYPLFGPPRDAAQAIVKRGCALAGMRIPKPVDNLTVRLIVRGCVENVGYDRWLARRARERNVSGTVQILSSGAVKATLSGPLEHVAALVTAAIDGPSQAHVNFVHTSQTADTPPSGQFAILS